MGTAQVDEYVEIARRIRDEVSFFSGSACQAQHREDWPQLWGAIDDLVSLVDREHQRPTSGPSLFSTFDQAPQVPDG